MTAKTEAPDIFLWANQSDAAKNELEIDLYLFTKNYTVYQVQHTKNIEPYARALFLYDLINAVQLGAGTGLKIRDIHDNDGEKENVIDFVDLQTVPNAAAVIEQIAYSEEVDQFSFEEHEIKRMAGIVARCTIKGQKPFFIAKQLQKSTITEGKESWKLQSSKFDVNPIDAVVKIAADNQTLVIGEHVFVFNASKFTRLFGYDAEKKAMLDGKLAEIQKQFKLSFPEGLDMDQLVKANSSLAEKLLRSEPLGITQDQVIEQADKFGLALMTDDNGAIIIMDARDANMFANLLNDDYVESDMTDKHYLAVKKKEVFDTEDKQMHLGA